MSATTNTPPLRNVIVLGGSGFIGHQLVATLRERTGAEGVVVPVSSREADLVNRQSVFDWFERTHWTFEVDHIFHLAAVYKAGGWPATHPATQFHSNMAININALEAWKRFQPQARFTSVVSYCMYPDHDQPHPESELYGTEPEPYLFAYAFTKKALLVGQEAYCKEHGMSATSVVLPTVYGPGDSFATDSHVMGALIGKFCAAKRDNLPDVEVWGDGRQVREFLFVEDAAEGIISAALNATSPVLNLGTGGGVTIAEVAEAICEIVGYEGPIRYERDRFVGAIRRVLDCTRAQNEIGWSPRTPLREGIRRTTAGLLGNEG